MREIKRFNWFPQSALSRPIFCHNVVVPYLNASRSTPARHRHNKYHDEINRASSESGAFPCKKKNASSSRNDRSLCASGLNLPYTDDWIDLDRDRRDTTCARYHRQRLAACVYRCTYVIPPRVENAPVTSTTEGLDIATRQTMSSPVFSLDPTNRAGGNKARKTTSGPDALLRVVQLAQVISRENV